MSNKFDKFIKDISTVRDNIGKDDEEETLDRMMYKHVLSTSIDIVNNKHTKSIFKSIESKLGEDVSEQLIELFVLSMTHSAHDAVAYYDGLLWDQLNERFKYVIDEINKNRSTLEAHDAVLNVQRKKLDDIDKQIKLTNLKI